MSFDDMIAALFTDPILSKAAVYLPKGSAEAIDVRVMTKQPDIITDFGEGQIHAATTLFEVQRKEIAQPKTGDRLTVDGITYIVQSEPMGDRERLIWRLDVIPA